MASNEMVTTGRSASLVRGANVVRHLVDGLVIGLIGAALRRTPVGRLHVTLPSGRNAIVGRVDREIGSKLDLKSYRVVSQVLRRGPLGFADSYMSGDIATDNLLGLFDYYMDNEAALAAAVPDLVRSGWPDRAFHRKRANTRTGSQRNIAAHYDLGNAFYRLWLDEGLTYSSGIYANAETTLDAAQTEKYSRILAALDVRPYHDVLEIGCGWGSFAKAAAERAASVTGITISKQQFEEASARMARSNLGTRVRIRLEDYRDTVGSFDRVASIEMIEAVGEENWPVYFDSIADRLKLGGKAVIQAITIRDDLFESYRSNPDFIQRYIFPGGMLSTKEAMHRHANASGLGFEVLETFGASYALTLAEWRRRFNEAWPRIAALGFDERFRRMWDYYLCYCQVGFERGSIDVGLYRLSKASE
jgi:cyclopropane-fatty-acyl-phospholipid synthase